MELLKSLLRIAVILAVVVPTTLLLAQSKMIYLPRSYAGYDDFVKMTSMRAYPCGDRKHTVFLWRPSNASDESKVPERIWWLFGGNGALALDWMPSIMNLEDPDTLFVLVDYPGYGYNKGKPSPKSVAEAVDCLHDFLAKGFGISPEELSARSAVTGHSLGAAAALDTAARHGIDEVIAISPFTTMKDMAARTVGRLLSNLLRHRWNNEQSLAELAKNPDAKVTMFHGTQDEVIPFAMGKTLAERYPEMIEFHSVEGIGHNDIIDALQDQLVQRWAAK